MMGKKPVGLYGYSILPLMIEKEYKVLGAWAVIQKSVLQVKSALGRDETVLFFSFFNK